MSEGLQGYPGFIKDIPRGHTKDFAISVSRAGVPVDITGAKFYISFSKELDPAVTPDLELTIDPPTDPLNGKTTGVISDSETLALEPGTYYYTVKYINALGAAYVLDLAQIEVYNTTSNRVT